MIYFEARQTVINPNTFPGLALSFIGSVMDIIAKAGYMSSQSSDPKSKVSENGLFASTCLNLGNASLMDLQELTCRGPSNNADVPFSGKSKKAVANVSFTLGSNGSGSAVTLYVI